MNESNNNGNIENESMIDYKAVNEDIKENGHDKMMDSIMERRKRQSMIPFNLKKENKSRINAYISKRNYEFINDLMTKGELISMKLSKGAILDRALTNLFKTLDDGDSLEEIAIYHLEMGD